MNYNILFGVVMVGVICYDWYKIIKQESLIKLQKKQINSIFKDVKKVEELSNKHHNEFTEKLKNADNKYKKYYARITYVLKYIKKSVPAKSNMITRDHIDNIIGRLNGNGKRGKKKNGN